MSQFLIGAATWLALLISGGTACFPGSGRSDIQQNPQEVAKDPIRSKFGELVQSSDYDESGWSSKTLSDASKLNCDFDGPCCWHNEPHNGGIPAFVWASESGDVDIEKLLNHFHTDSAPSGGFLSTAVPMPGRLDDYAALTSCPLRCKNVKVTITKWSTPETVLEICQQDSTDTASIDWATCQTIDGANGSPKSVTMAGSNKPYSLVILSTGFTEKEGLVVIDDVKVSGSDCSGNSAVIASAKGVCCDWEQGLCQYTPVATDLGDNWRIVAGRSGNRDTGVPGPDSGSSKFVGSRPRPNGGQTMLQSGTINNDKELTILPRFYEATDNMILKLCIDDVSASDCHDISRSGVDAGDRQWNTKRGLKIPVNTKQIFWVCDNEGTNIGNCGLDKITVHDAAGTDLCAAAEGTTTASSGFRRKRVRQQQRHN